MRVNSEWVKQGYADSTNSRALHDWFDYCARNSMPYIVVWRKKKYAKVTSDLITVEPDGCLNETGYLEVARLYYLYGVGKDDYFGTILTQAEVPLKYADEYAAKLVAILSNQANRKTLDNEYTGSLVRSFIEDIRHTLDKREWQVACRTKTPLIDLGWRVADGRLVKGGAA